MIKRLVLVAMLLVAKGVQADPIPPANYTSSLSLLYLNVPWNLSLNEAVGISIPLTTKTMSASGITALAEGYSKSFGGYGTNGVDVFSHIERNPPQNPSALAEVDTSSVSKATTEYYFRIVPKGQQTPPVTTLITADGWVTASGSQNGAAFAQLDFRIWGLESSLPPVLLQASDVGWGQQHYEFHMSKQPFTLVPNFDYKVDISGWAQSSTGGLPSSSGTSLAARGKSRDFSPRHSMELDQDCP